MPWARVSLPSQGWIPIVIVSTKCSSEVLMDDTEGPSGALDVLRVRWEVLDASGLIC